MVIMFDLTPYMGIIYAVIIIAGVGITLKVVLNSAYMKSFAKVKVEKQKTLSKPRSIFDKWRNTLEDPDNALNEIERHMADQRGRGVTDEQMTLLNSEKDLINKYAKNEYVQIVGPAVLDKVQQIAKGFGLKL